MRLHFVFDCRTLFYHLVYFRSLYQCLNCTLYNFLDGDRHHSHHHDQANSAKIRPNESSNENLMENIRKWSCSSSIDKTKWNETRCTQKWIGNETLLTMTTNYQLHDGAWCSFIHLIYRCYFSFSKVVSHFVVTMFFDPFEIHTRARGPVGGTSRIHFQIYTYICIHFAKWDMWQMTSAKYSLKRMSKHFSPKIGSVMGWLETIAMRSLCF